MKNIFFCSIAFPLIVTWVQLDFLTGFQKSINDSFAHQEKPVVDSLVTDIDGNIYHPVKIGNQFWLKENLKVTRYRDGEPIPQVNDDEAWSVLTSGAYCLNEDDPEDYKETYGILYNYYAVSDVRNICPEGWHVPTKEEWEELEDFLGGQSIAGGKMKDLQSGLWHGTPKSENLSDFSALPAGGRGRLGKPADVGFYATWWAATSYDSLYAWHWGLYPDKNSTRRNPGHKTSGFSVRCIKD